MIRESIRGYWGFGNLHAHRTLDSRNLAHLGAGEGYRVVREVGPVVIRDLVVVQVVVVMAGHTHRLDRGERRRCRGVGFPRYDRLVVVERRACR